MQKQLNLPFPPNSHTNRPPCLPTSTVFSVISSISTSFFFTAQSSPPFSYLHPQPAFNNLYRPSFNLNNPNLYYTAPPPSTQRQHRLHLLRHHPPRASPPPFLPSPTSPHLPSSPQSTFNNLHHRAAPLLPPRHHSSLNLRSTAPHFRFLPQPTNLPLRAFTFSCLFPITTVPLISSISPPSIFSYLRPSPPPRTPSHYFIPSFFLLSPTTPPSTYLPRSHTNNPAATSFALSHRRPTSSIFSPERPTSIPVSSFNLLVYLLHSPIKSLPKQISPTASPFNHHSILQISPATPPQVPPPPSLTHRPNSTSRLLPANAPPSNSPAPPRRLHSNNNTSPPLLISPISPSILLPPPLQSLQPTINPRGPSSPHFP